MSIGIDKHASEISKGFTLVELLVVIAILSVVLTGVIGLFVQSTRHHTNQEMLVETAAQAVRAAKSLMIDEIRSAGTNPIDKIRVGFQTKLLGNVGEKYDTDDESISFTRDIDNNDSDALYEPDGDVDGTDEAIAYYRIDGAGNLLSAGNNTPGILVRDTGAGGQPVADNITDLRFTYYNDSNIPITGTDLNNESSLSDIKTVEVVIVGQVENTARLSSGDGGWTQQFRIRVRNR